MSCLGYRQVGELWHSKAPIQSRVLADGSFTSTHLKNTGVGPGSCPGIQAEGQEWSSATTFGSHHLSGVRYPGLDSTKSLLELTQMVFVMGLWGKRGHTPASEPSEISETKCRLRTCPSHMPENGLGHVSCQICDPEIF